MNILLSLLPVLFFLIFLVYLDSFKLVKTNTIILCFIWGVFTSGAAYFLNSFFLTSFQIEFSAYSRYISPWLEEILKALFLFYLLNKGKAGFMIDSAILGFSIGTGFAFIENIYYLNILQAENPGVWLVRGFGTAIMHGGTTALLGIFAAGAGEKFKITRVSAGILLAVSIHAFYNQFFISPVVTALILFFSLPVVIAYVFQHNENSLRKWLEVEFDTEVNILKMINKGMFSDTKTGKFIVSIKNHFTPEAIVDLLCYIKIYTELSIRAKSNMLLRESGFPVRKDPEIPEKLKELDFLQKNIGKTGLYAVSPILRMSKKDIWKLNQL